MIWNDETLEILAPSGKATPEVRAAEMVGLRIAIKLIWEHALSLSPDWRAAVDGSVNAGLEICSRIDLGGLPPEQREEARAAMQGVIFDTLIPAGPVQDRIDETSRKPPRPRKARRDRSSRP